tara:strand:- start:6247 stop:6861 length:615 start_codon:yes stop_codon:yes gene_type:complete
MAGKGKFGKFIEGKARGALENLSDVFTSKDAPVDESRRQFIKQAPVATAGGAGALAGLGTATALGAKALFSQGKFDDILAKIKDSFDPDAYDDIYSAGETLQKKLGIDDSEFAKISEETTAMDDALYYQDLNIDNMNSSEVAELVRNSIDDIFESLIWDHKKGRGENPMVLVDEFKIPAFKLEVEKNFPNLDQDEVDDLAKRLF